MALVTRAVLADRQVDIRLSHFLLHGRRPEYPAIGPGGRRSVPYLGLATGQLRRIYPLMPDLGHVVAPAHPRARPHTGGADVHRSEDRTKTHVQKQTAIMKIPIVFSCDQHVAMPAGVCISSLLANAREETHYDIYILHNAENLRAEHQREIEKIKIQ